jgi:hypothetical protein
MPAISLSDYQLPDEHVDYAISFDAETSENQELLDVNVQDIRTHFKEDSTENSHDTNDLNDSHLLDEDASVLWYYDDDSDTTESEGPQSAKDLLGYIVPIRWIRCNDNSTKQLPEKRSVMRDMALSECHLPDEYVDAIFSYDSSRNEVSSPIGDLIGSVITSFWLGSNDSTTKEHRPVMNEICLNDCHLPDDYVDVVLSSFSATNPSERRSATNFKFHCKERTSAEPSPSFDRSMERLVRVISTDSKANESSSSSKLSWVFADEASKAKKDDSYAPKMIPITGVYVGKNPVEASVSLATVSRGALRRRTSTQSVSWSTRK